MATLSPTLFFDPHATSDRLRGSPFVVISVVRIEIGVGPSLKAGPNRRIFS
uniref:Uncharacterized protein F3.1 n=1 Tax=Haloquadratum walsbyi TaxID=293091 RepID=A0A445MQJ4_9EURY|nr:uncharacterized protein F3.1 [Haloquadratum walsbyi]